MGGGAGIYDPQSNPHPTAPTTHIVNMMGGPPGSISMFRALKVLQFVWTKYNGMMSKLKLDLERR